MKTQLVLTALGHDQSGLIKQISQHILEQGLNIEDSRMSVLGGEFAFMLLISGDKNTLDQFVNSKSEIENKFSDLIINTKYTQARQIESSLSYKVKILALDHQGIVHNLARFFSERDINIEDLHTKSYPAPHTGSKMFAVELRINIPNETSISRLRDAFIEHCDNLNLDASFEADSHH